MYCQCPHCGTGFAIGAGVLRAGRGQVRCGRCLEVFDAFGSLSDEPPGGKQGGMAHPSGAQARSSPEAPRRETQPGAEDDFGMQAGAEPEPEDDTVERTQPMSLIERMADLPAPEPEEVTQDRAAEEGVTFPGEAPAGRAGGGRRTERAAAEEEVRPLEPAPVPAVLQADLERTERVRSARRSRRLYALASLALVVALLGQVAWWQPARVLTFYPGAYSLLHAFCGATGCTLPERRDPADIEVLSRVVRPHPRYEGVLQVMAKIENEAPFAQPYPPLQFTLYDVTGEVISSRVLDPAQYLGHALPRGAVMPVGVPEQIRFAVVTPEQAAVSYEFSFR